MPYPVDSRHVRVQNLVIVARESKQRAFQSPGLLAQLPLRGTPSNTLQDDCFFACHRHTKGLLPDCLLSLWTIARATSIAHITTLAGHASRWEWLSPRKGDSHASR